MKRSSYSFKRLLIVLGVLSCFTIAQVQVALALSEFSTAHVDAGPEGGACMHGYIYSSDTTPLAGPGAGDVDITARQFLAACPTVLIRSDGNPFALCTSMLGRNPVARLLDQTSGRELARLSLDAGALLGGVYAYLDRQDRLVMVDGNQNLIRIKAQDRYVWGKQRWQVSIDESVSLLSTIAVPCGEDGCDAVVSISPGAEDTIWFVTQQAVVGIYDPHTGAVSTLKLAVDERIDNSFSTTADGRAAVVTSKALYVLQQDQNNLPQIAWRQAYDAGTARKPGQLSHGSGATPTFFGPETGFEFVTITDNADDTIALIVRDTDSGELVCQKAIFTDKDNSGTENSAIAFGTTVVVASTYGYPYPELPGGAGPSIPAQAEFVGGIVRVDCQTCDIVWENSVRSAAVPKFSIPDQLIYTIERQSSGLLNAFYFTAIDLDTGQVVKQSKLNVPLFANTLQMAGNIGEEGVYWQGTMGGVVRIAPVP